MLISVVVVIEGIHEPHKINGDGQKFSSRGDWNFWKETIIHHVLPLITLNFTDIVILCNIAKSAKSG